MTQPVGCRDFVTFALRISDLNTRPIVRTVDSPRLHTKDPTIIEDLTAVGKELEEDGVRAIICACGYFGRWQKNGNPPVWIKKTHIPPLAFVGRHTLWIYLFHQPVLLLLFELITVIIR